MKVLIYSLLVFFLSVPMVFAGGGGTGGVGGNGSATGGVGGNGSATGGVGPNNSAPAPSVSPGTTQLRDPLDGNISSIPAFFRAVIEILLIFAIPFVVFFIIWAGFLYVTARGNASKIEQAHKALLYALVGGLLILGANVLLDIITNTVSSVAN